MSTIMLESPPERVAELRGNFGRLNLRDVTPIDGDTLRATVEVPFIDMALLVLAQTIRVSMPDDSPFDVFESRGEEKSRGLLAKADAQGLLLGARCALLCRGRDKYGRLLGPVEVEAKVDDGTKVFDLATRMRELGHDRNWQG